jgi:hypothetical protein
MANTIALIPTAEGLYSESTLGAGADVVAAVKTMDSGTTYVYSLANAGAKRLSYFVDGNMISYDSVINSVDVKVWAAGGSGTLTSITVQAGFIIGGTTYLQAAQNVTSQTYVLFTFPTTVNPSTLSAWTKYDLDSLEIVLRINAGTGTAPIHITQCYADISFEPNSDALSIG